MNKHSDSLINGIKTDYLSINDRAIHYGDGIFETILCEKNRLYFWQQHYQRLQKSAQKLNMHCPHEDILLHDIKQLLATRADEQNAYAVKIILSRGCGERGYRYSKSQQENRLVLLSSIATDYSSLLSGKLFSGELCFCRQQVSINENLAGLKHLNRLENVIARNEWHEEYLDGLMLNASQHVIEGSMSNIFGAKNGEIYTPDLSQSGIDGIMRQIIIDLAAGKSIPVHVQNLGREEILAMDELFISNSLIAMKSIAKLEDRIFTDNIITDLLFHELLKTSTGHAQVI